MEIQVRGLALVQGALTRKAIVEILQEYATRHAKVRRIPLIKIKFVTMTMFEGEKWGGLQQGSQITLSTRSIRNRRLSVHELVHALYHELYHLSQNGVANARPGCKGRLELYDPADWQQEIGAILSSNLELDNWSSRLCRTYSINELKSIAPFAKDWPKS